MITAMLSLPLCRKSLHLMVERSSDWAPAGAAISIAAAKIPATMRMGHPQVPAELRLSSMIRDPNLMVKGGGAPPEMASRRNPPLTGKDERYPIRLPNFAPLRGGCARDEHQRQGLYRRDLRAPDASGHRQDGDAAARRGRRRRAG